MLNRVYAAALAASGDRAVAEQVSERVMLAASGDRDAPDLVEHAVLLAVRTAPHDAFAPMCARERDAIALARLAGATTTRVAAVLGVDPAEARSLMSSGLRALVSAGGAPRTPPPLPGCESAASPAHAGHAS